MLIKPSLTYCGLTIILERPSRFDEKSLKLLSANAGSFIDNECLRPEFNRYQCELRTKEECGQFLPNTKAILLLGEEAAKQWYGSAMKDNNLNEVRGSVFHTRGIPTIASYFPQDAVDIKNYEEAHRLKTEVYEVPVDKEEDGDSGYEEKSRHNNTSRKNFGFWLQQDIKKIKYLLKNGGVVPARPFNPEYTIYPKAEHVIEELTKHKNEHLYFDIETDYSQNLLCFAFNFRTSPHIFVVPVINYDYQWSYSVLPQIFRALAIAFRDNILVCHNGSGFDYPVLCHRYKLPIYRVYDTMAAQHRCFPEVEKSLGHCTTLCTWEPFHKDEGGGGYNNTEQCRNMWSYCGKDVFTMKLIHAWQESYAKRIPGLAESIEQVNESIMPYVVTMLQGIRYVQSGVDEMFKENDRLMMQYIKLARVLIGDKTVDKIRRKSKKPMLNSNVQACAYFHDELRYDIVARSKKSGKPSLAKQALFKLKLQHENPVIDLCIAYRELAKESGSLKFTPWKT